MHILLDLIDELPPDVVEDLPPGVIEQIREKGLETLPDSIVDQLPDTVVDRIPAEFLSAAGNNPALTAVLLIVGILALVGFFYGVAKSAFKAAVFFGIVAAGAWFWFFNA
jgi:hypothetical protein